MSNDHMRADNVKYNGSLCEVYGLIFTFAKDCLGNGFLSLIVSGVIHFYLKFYRL